MTMEGVKHSQLAPLPLNLNFRLVSKTIGSGAYACIKKGAPTHAETPIFAVKFINKEYAEKYGRIKRKQIVMEVTLHQAIGLHRNIVEFFSTGEDQGWIWICMELADGGDLFDKIEADAGVPQDIAHVYFTQMVNGIAYIHSKGIAHRDIKPENILVSSEGDLKIADFGMAVLFEYGGKRKNTTTLCGSPPYVAPEVLSHSSRGSVKGIGYAPDQADIWSCGVVLFVLLAGNTPWAKPVPGKDEYGRANEFSEYIETHGHPQDELWEELPTEVLSLLRGMMRVDVKTRFSFDEVRRHPWFTRPNKYLDADGHLVDPLALATSMFESMRVSLEPSHSAQDDMQIDSRPHLTIPHAADFSSTQPVTPAEDMQFDWESAADRRNISKFASTQPIAMQSRTFASTQPAHHIAATQNAWLEEEPSLSQFTKNPQVPLTRTQLARKFEDILPATSMTRFYSTYTLNLLMPLLLESLTRLKIPTSTALSTRKFSAIDTDCVVKIRTADTRGCSLSGTVILSATGEGLIEVEFAKGSGDPLEWRRLFKKITILCRDAVYVP